MRFQIQKNIIENIVASLQSFLNKKDSSSITSHIYIEIFEDTAIFQATDYEMGCKAISSDIFDQINGKATVNGANILNIIRRLNDDIITFETEDNHINIIQKKSHFKLPMFNPDQYPEFVKMEELNILDIDSIDFISSIKKITTSIDNTNPKIELNGALINIQENEIDFVGTDTRRLSVVSIQKQSAFEDRIIIPKKAIIEMQKIFLDKALIKYNDTYLTLSNEYFTFFTKLLNGNFPDYKRIIPQELSYNFLLPKQKLIESIKMVTSIEEKVKIIFKPNEVVFESFNDKSESKTQFDANFDISQDIFVALNSKYILDFLNSSVGDIINIGINNSSLPFVVKDDNFITIIMPIATDN